MDLKANKLEIRLKKFLRGIVKIFLDDINAMEGTAYDTGDIRIEFTRETITNDADNAQIELTRAQARQADVNTILNIATGGTIDQDTALKRICEILDIEYEEVKDKVPMKEEVDEAIGTLEEEPFSME